MKWPMLQKHTWNEKIEFVYVCMNVCVQNTIVLLSIVYGDIIENVFSLRLCDVIEFIINVCVLSGKSI